MLKNYCCLPKKFAAILDFLCCGTVSFGESLPTPKSAFNVTLEVLLGTGSGGSGSETESFEFLKLSLIQKFGKYFFSFKYFIVLPGIGATVS